MSCVKDFDGAFCLSQTVQVSAKKHKYLKEGSALIQSITVIDRGEYTQERSLSNVLSVIRTSGNQTNNRKMRHPHRREAIQML